MLPLLLALAQTTDSFGDRAWLRFSRAPSLAHTVQTVEVASDGRDGGVLRYRLRLTERRLDAVTAVRWADSRSCPAVRAVLTAMEGLTMPAPDAFGIGPDKGEIVLDGTGYRLEAPSTFASGRVTITSNIGSPLATWVDQSLRALAPCWTDAAPAPR